MLTLLSYDIENDRLRLQVANRLLADGFVRLQLSVFAGDPAEALWNRLLHWIQNEVLPQAAPGDKFLYLPLPEGQARSLAFLPAAPPEWSDLLDPPHTLFV